MNRIKFDSDLMKLMTLFESMTGANVKDCIANEKITFIIGEGDMGKAIGKNGSNIKRMENMVKKKIRLVEFSNDVVQFVKNSVYPVEALSIEQENGIVTIHGKDTNTRAMLIGRERQNINHLSDIVKRHFDIKDIKVA
ncbi:NusA-like transcription termination signal-binding factor [Candidatus Woesearchaeota archaeon]|nr:NusA-like transcription termination signal-binding factor [Candidatus Woesearchaeota archaeon]